MDVLVLGGTGWLSGEVARQGVARGHRVTALARGSRGRPAAPDGVRLVRADRADRASPGAYADVAGRDWDLVVDVSDQPGRVRDAVAALGSRARRWVYVSSGSVYDAASGPTADESTPTVDPLDDDEATVEQFGPGKVACENAVLEALGDRAAVVRAGLIGGPGDASDRWGYYPAAFARAADRPVLVPGTPEALVQTVDVRDLAAFLLDLASSDLTGSVDVYGEPTRFAELVATARRITGHTGDVVEADPAWLAERGVGYFMGPRSLPLWLPDGHPLATVRPSDRARAGGLRWRPVEETLAAALDDEREAGLDRDRRAGLTRTEERELLDAWAARP